MSPLGAAVIVIVFVSLGGILCLSLLAFVICRLFKKTKKKTRETDIIHIDEEKQVKGSFVSDPFGQKSVVVSVEGDRHVTEDITRSEKLGHPAHGLHTNSSSAVQGNLTTTRTNDEVATTSAFPHDDQDHHQPEHKP